MSEFAERLNYLMFERGLNRKQLAGQLGINAACVTHYLHAKRVPTVANLVKIADFFNCSADYLLGREEMNPDLKFKPCPPFGERIEFLKQTFGCSSYSIYHATDISQSCYYDWKSGRRQPSLDNIIKLANHFDCRVDFILGRES